MKRVRATAIVAMNLRVPVPDVWGPECPIEQVHRQAVRSALDIIKSGRFSLGELVVGDPVVTQVLVEEDR